MDYCVATFRSVHDALYCEQKLKEIGLNLQLIPVPREISSTCGIAARFPVEERDNFVTAIEEQELTIIQIHTLTEK